jgi:hypothetical protein
VIPPLTPEEANLRHNLCESCHIARATTEIDFRLFERHVRVCAGCKDAFEVLR